MMSHLLNSRTRDSRSGGGRRLRQLGGVLLCGLVALAATGCMTAYAQFPAGPTLPAVGARADASLIGMSPVTDDRADESAGTIGALKIAAGPDLISYVDRALRRSLQDAGFAVVAAPNPEELGDVGLANVFNGKVISVSVESASISTADAIMYPADCRVGLLARVYDRSGNLIYAESYMGKHRKTLGFHTAGKKEGEFLAAAADDAVERILKTQEFREAVK